MTYGEEEDPHGECRERIFELEVDSKTLMAILHDVESLHKRRCWDCGEIHWHADNRTPYVCCPDCNSQDTRLL